MIGDFKKDQWKAWVSLFRIPNILLIVLFFLVADHFLIQPLTKLAGVNPTLDASMFVMYVLDIIIVAWIGYWINDYYDDQIDSINKPHRALPSGLITKQTLIGMAIVAFGLGTSITLYLAIQTHNLLWSLLYPFVVLALLAYAKRGKKWGLKGNVLVSLMVAFLPAMLFIAEWPAIHRLGTTHPDVLNRIGLFMIALAVLLFTTNLAREIVKDAEDSKGDAIRSGQSIILKFGYKAMLVVLLMCFLSIATVQWCLYVYLNTTDYTLVATIFITFLLITCLFIGLKHNNIKGYRMISAFLKILMLIGILQILFLPRFA